MLRSNPTLLLVFFIVHQGFWFPTKASSFLKCGTYVDPVHPGCPESVHRVQWGAEEPKKVAPFKGPLKYVVVHHSDTPECYKLDSCAERLQNIQRLGRHRLQLFDSSGGLYMGRGRYVEGAHVKHYNDVAMGICMIGNFTTTVPTVKALTTLKIMIYSFKNRHGTQDGYQVRGHRDLGDTQCPGDALYEVVKNCPFYDGSSTTFEPSLSTTDLHTSSNTMASSTTASTTTVSRDLSGNPPPGNSAVRLFARGHTDIVLLNVFLAIQKFVKNWIY